MSLKPLLSLDQGSTAHRFYQLIGWAALAAVAIWLPFSASTTNVGRFSDSMAFAVAVMGLNIVTGLSGQVSLGHSAFMGTGAFTTAILVADHNWSFFATVPIAALFWFAVGIFVGVPALRLKGLYLALATLGLSIIFPKIVEKYEFTGGNNGKRLGRKRLVPPEWTHLDQRSDRHIWIYFVILTFTVVLFVLARNLFRSRPGRALIALRERVGCRGDHADLGAAGRKCAIEAATIEHEADVLHVRALRQSRHHRFGIGHLRHALRIHEAGNFYPADASIDEPADQLQLERSREHVGLALQAVARTHFDDFER